LCLFVTEKLRAIGNRSTLTSFLSVSTATVERSVWQCHF